MEANTKFPELIHSPIARFARPQRVGRIFPSPAVAVPNRENTLEALPNAQAEAPPLLPAGEPAGVGEWISSLREQIPRQLAAWQAPALPDEIVNTLATIFLMQPGHQVTPFFVWLDHRLRR